MINSKFNKLYNKIIKEQKLNNRIFAPNIIHNELTKDMNTLIKLRLYYPSDLYDDLADFENNISIQETAYFKRLQLIKKIIEKYNSCKLTSLKYNNYLAYNYLVINKLNILNEILKEFFNAYLNEDLNYPKIITLDDLYDQTYDDITLYKTSYNKDEFIPFKELVLQLRDFYLKYEKSDFNYVNFVNKISKELLK